jgi:hypothetical protein
MLDVKETAKRAIASPSGFQYVQITANKEIFLAQPSGATNKSAT